MASIQKCGKKYAMVYTYEDSSETKRQKWETFTTKREAASRKSQVEFERLKKSAGLPDVVFHSLRHSSTTYKLKINHGDIKATQGDTGHAQATMVTEVYAHIIDEEQENIGFRFLYLPGLGKQGQNECTGRYYSYISYKIIHLRELIVSLIKMLSFIAQS